MQPSTCSTQIHRTNCDFIAEMKPHVLRGLLQYKIDDELLQLRLTTCRHVAIRLLMFTSTQTLLQSLIASRAVAEWQSTYSGQLPTPTLL